MLVNDCTAETIQIGSKLSKPNRIAKGDTVCIMSSQGERLRQAIELAGFKKVAPFAESIGESPIKVRQHINRDRIPSDALDTYVQKLRPYGVTADWLLSGRGKPPKGLGDLSTSSVSTSERPSGATIEITHFVGAGDQVFPVPGDAPLGYIAAPPRYEQGGAVAIRGDSGRPLFDDKDLLFYRQWESPPASARHMPHRAVIIELEDGRSFVKLLMPGTKKGRYHLLSINQAVPPIYDVAVKAIARIGCVYFGGLTDADGEGGAT